jgi:hypothetical protein
LNVIDFCFEIDCFHFISGTQRPEFDSGIWTRRATSNSNDMGSNFRLYYHDGNLRSLSAWMNSAFCIGSWAEMHHTRVGCPN